MKTMKTCTIVAAAAAGLALGAATAHAQSGTISKAVGGYSFEDAAKEAPGHQELPFGKDGQLTFAIVTHTAGNGFFDPVYVGAKVAADMFGVKLIMLGSEAPVDDIPREIEILNQIVQDPTIDGLIMTTPQVGAYNDIVKKLREPRHPGRDHQLASIRTLYDRNSISHTGQDASAAAIGGEALVECLARAQGIKGGSILFPSTDRRRQCRGQQPRHRGLHATVAKALKAAGKLGDFKVDAGPDNIGIDVDTNNLANSHRDADRKARRRGRRCSAPTARSRRRSATRSPSSRSTARSAPTASTSARSSASRSRPARSTGALGQQPFLQGFWPVMQLYLQIDRGIAAANLDTRAQLVTKDNVGNVGKRFEN